MGSKNIQPQSVVTVERYDEGKKRIVNVRLYIPSRDMDKAVEVSHFLGTQGFDPPFITGGAFGFYKKGGLDDVENVFKAVVKYLKKKAVKLFTGESEETLKQNHIYYLAYLDFVDFI